MSEFKVAVIGSGYWGKNLVRNYDRIGALKMICDTNEETLARFKEEYPEAETALSYSDVLSNDGIDGIIIATPAETHFNLAKEALLADKHVYVEKPLVLNEGEAEELIMLAKDRGLILMVGHLLQYHPIFVKLRELVETGDLGRINYIYSNRLNLGKIRREENILWSFAPHDISMILSLTGEEPNKVIATGGNYLHRHIADVTTTHLEFPSGTKAHIFVSWLHPFKEQKLVVVGDKKMAVFDDTQPWEDKLLLYPHKVEWEKNIPVPNKADAERVEVHQDEPLFLECKHFLECIETGVLPRTDAEEGLRVLKVLNASQESMNRNGAKVLLNTSKDKNSAQIHETAFVDAGTTIGKNTKIWHFSHVMKNTTIGENCNLGQNVVAGPDVIIGNGCKIQNNVSVYKGVTLEDDVFCGPSMVFTNVFNPRAHVNRMSEVRETLIKKGATLGANCTIVCGNTVGKYAFIGAGAVITKDVPDYALMLGTPAKRTGWVCECGEILPQSLECVSCNKKYEKKGATDLIPCK
ncbi:Gfo/Idh/MocA family oxidoreductase [Desulfovibrio sp. JC022]|uniref:Gfo/Idh/MocA family oxidoreductase n=1 Tax=Desulfovibrio sp. JC022 TaxID=2593642 RepID=UPI0013D34AAA|nr:Gfo/Idh/MocA family oxidoreductase [Desulfovibrio sp. JC022]NDV22173.1 oxidoreductase [Desulfovibrio sp. JC022]